MSLSTQQAEALQGYRETYELALKDGNTESAMNILNRLREEGFSQEAKTLLNETKLSDVADYPTQEEINGSFEGLDGLPHERP